MYRERTPLLIVLCAPHLWQNVSFQVFHQPDTNKWQMLLYWLVFVCVASRVSWNRINKFNKAKALQSCAKARLWDDATLCEPCGAKKETKSQATNNKQLAPDSKLYAPICILSYFYLLHHKNENDGKLEYSCERLFFPPMQMVREKFVSLAAAVEENNAEELMLWNADASVVKFTRSCCANRVLNVTELCANRSATTNRPNEVLFASSINPS